MVIKVAIELIVVMKDIEYERSEIDLLKLDANMEYDEKDSLYTETFKSSYTKHLGTFISIWERQNNIIHDSNLNSAQKATATVNNLIQGGMSAFSTVTNFTSHMSEDVMLPLLRTVNIAKGIGCLPVCKQLDPVINLIDIHFVIIPPSPAPVPVPHPFMGFSLRPKDFLALAAMTVSIGVSSAFEDTVNQKVDNGGLSEENAELINDSAQSVTNFARIFIGNLGASVKVGIALPRTVAGTSIRCLEHAPMGGGFHPVAENTITKNTGHSWLGSMFVVADGSPLVGAFAHLQNVCSDVGMTSIHDASPKPDPEKGIKAKLYVPTGMIIPIPVTRAVLTNPVPSPINPMQAPKMLLRAGFNKLKTKRAKKVNQRNERELPCSNTSRALNRVNNKLFNHKYTVGLYDKIDKKLKTYVGHPIDVVGGDLFTESIDFRFEGVIPLSFERVWYSDSAYIGPLGYGWHHSFDMALFVNEEFQRAQVRLGDGRLINFDLIPTREFPKSRYHRSEKMWLCYHADGYYYIKDQKGEKYLFNTMSYPDKQGAHLLAAICNHEGFSIRFTYNASGTLTMIKDSVNRVYMIESDTKGRIVKIWTDAPEEGSPILCIAEYVYDQNSNLTAHYDEIRQPLQMMYEKHLLVKETWRNGHQWYFKYDGTKTGARCIESWGDGDIHYVNLTYYNGETHMINGEGNKTIYKHRNQLVYETIDAKGAVWKKYYNKYSELERSINPLGYVQTFIHDDCGNVVQVIEPDGQFTQIKYVDADYPHLPTEMIDSRGGKWSCKYNQAGRIREICNPMDTKIHYTYNANGFLSSMTNELGSTIQLEYDRRHNVAVVESLKGEKMQYKYDLWNRLTHCIQANGIEQKRVLDALGRALVIHDFDGNTIQLKYDALDNVIQYEDHHRTIQFCYKGIHKLISRCQDNKIVRYQYDSNERLRRIINEEGQQYTFDLDEVGDLVQEKGFDGIEKRYKRNNAGWITEIHRPASRWTKYCYDEMGHITQVDYSDASKESYVYEAGLLRQAVNSSGILEWQYNRLGEVLKECFNGKTVESSYDVYGRLTGIQSSLGANFTYELDKWNNVVECHFNDWKVTRTYDDFLGFECMRSYQGGMQEVWEYDRIGRLQTQRVNQVSTTAIIPQFFRQYTWEEGGYLRQITDQGQKHTFYQHNRRGFLESVIYQGDEKEERGTDASGNLYQQLTCKDRIYNKNRLEETEINRYQYDDEGYLIEKEVKLTGKKWKYQWNGAGMLSRVVRPDGEAVDLFYDALGRRVSKRYRSVITHYVWQSDVILHEYKTFIARETTAEDIITWAFEEDSFVPMVKIKGNSKYSLVNDHLGTPIRGYTDQGDKVWERELDSCGNARMIIGDEGFCTYLYQGQLYDKETGLAYNRFRYYDPEVGNYISQDPIGLAGNNPTLYGYVADPTQYLDPFGLNLTDQMTFKEAFRRAKQQLRIPKYVNTPKREYVFDNQYENRTVWAFTGDYQGKFIILHKEDKFGRGPHLHTADGKKGSPLVP